jgi:hypothetical protein
MSSVGKGCEGGREGVGGKRRDELKITIIEMTHIVETVGVAWFPLMSFVRDCG